MRNKTLLTGYILALLFLLLDFQLTHSAEFGKNKVRYKQFTWCVLQTKHFEVYFNPDIEHLAKLSASFAEEAYKELSEDLSYKVPRRIPFILFKSHYDFQQTNIVLELIERGVGGFAEVFKYRMVIPFTGSIQQLRHVIRHELTHIFTFSILYEDILHSIFTNKFMYSPPLWMMEGLAEYKAGKIDAEDRGILCDTVLRNNIAPIRELANFHDIHPYLAYKQSESLISYIAKRFGEEKLGQMLRIFKRHLNTEKMVRESLGISLDRLEEDWINSLKAEFYPLVEMLESPTFYGRRIVSSKFSYSNTNPAWSPGGEMLATLINRGGYLDINLISLRTGKEVQSITAGMRTQEFEELKAGARVLSWSKDGRLIAFIAKKEELDALFLWDVIQSKLKKKIKLQDVDFITSIDFSPNGEMLTLAGCTNGKMNIYLLDIQTEKLSKLTSGDLDSEPAFSKDGEWIAFVREENGGKNIYFISRDGTQERPLIKNNFNNINPCWSSDGKELFFSSDMDGFYEIYCLNIQTGELFKITSTQGGSFQPTISNDGKHLAFVSFYRGRHEIYLIEKIKKKLFKPKMQRREILKISQISDFEIKKYETKMTLDWIQGELFFSTNTGFRAFTTLAASDILGNHRFILFTDYLSIIEGLADLNFQILYLYLTRRPSVGIGAFNWKDSYTSLGKEYVYNEYGGILYLAYPFSKFRRGELYFQCKVEEEGERGKEKREEFDLIGVSFVHDTTIWGKNGPLDGSRSRVSVERTINLLYDQLDFTKFEIDLRKYKRLGFLSNIAFRFVGKVSEGEYPDEFYLGGSGWWESEMLRGFEEYRFSGTRIALLNIEGRIPLISKIDFTFPQNFQIKDIRGVFFIDSGLAWSRDKEVKLWNLEPNFSLDDLKFSYGFGFRVVLGMFPLKIDFAWTTDFLRILGKRYHLSIGYDF